VSPKQTVAAGTWILARAGVDDALAGDLAEHIAGGAPTRWYWRQVISSIVLAWVGVPGTARPSCS